MKEILELKNRLMKKKQEQLSLLETEKIEIISEVLDNPEMFFQLEMDTVLGMLNFLSYGEEEAMRIYMSLISPVNYKENIPQIYDIKDSNTYK